MYKICHTEDSSRRQREMEAGLLEVMKTQPYDRITMSDLCRRMNIPRKSFYRYFPTKDDCLMALMDHTLTDCNARALSLWQTDGILRRENLERFFAYWQEQQAFLDAVRDNGLQSRLLDRTTAIVDAMKAGRESGNFAREQGEYFIAYGLMATALRWHHHGFPATAGEMAEVFAGLLSSPEISMDRLVL